MMAKEQGPGGSKVWEKYSQPGDYGIKGWLYPGGVLTYRIRTKAASSESAQDGTPPGRVMFREMIDAYGRQNIVSIHDKWIRFPPLNGNYISYQEARKNGLSPNEAVFETFTGKMAADMGMRYGRMEAEEHYYVTAVYKRFPFQDAFYVSPAVRPGW